MTHICALVARWTDDPHHLRRDHRRCSSAGAASSSGSRSSRPSRARTSPTPSCNDTTPSTARRGAPRSRRACRARRPSSRPRRVRRAITCRCSSGRGVSMNLRPSVRNARFGRASRRSTLGLLVAPFGSKRSATFTPSAAAIRLSDATLAFARPRSTWLRKLSERSERSATVFSVIRRRRRITRSRSPTSTLAPSISYLRAHRRKLKRHYSSL